MRTTIAIDDHLLAEAKERARARRQTLGELVEDALRRELAVVSQGDRPAIPVVHGAGGAQAGVDLSSNRALLEALDEGRGHEERR